MLQKERAGDYVLATGEEHSVRDFVQLAFDMVGRPLEWDGSGVEEKGIDRKTGKTVIEVDPSFYRPAEVNALVGNASKARDELGWVHKTSFAELVAEMVEADMRRTADSLAVNGGIRA